MFSVGKNRILSPEFSALGQALIVLLNIFASLTLYCIMPLNGLTHFESLATMFLKLTHFESLAARFLKLTHFESLAARFLKPDRPV